MDLVDRSVIPSLHAAARHHRAVYLNCLFATWAAAIARLFSERPTTRAAPCA